MWCFLRKTLQSLNPSLPPKLPTKLLRLPESSTTASVLVFVFVFFIFYRLCTHNVPFVVFNLVRELMCLSRVYLRIRSV